MNVITMVGSDVVMANAGGAFDGFASSKSMPDLMETQDITDVSISNVDGVLRVAYRRRLQTGVCDARHVLALTDI